MGSSSATEHILSWAKDANCGSTATWRRLQQCYKPRRNQLISQPTSILARPRLGKSLGVTMNFRC